MKKWLEDQEFEIFVETPKYMTIRARAPKGYEFADIDMTGKTFDFALCRTDGEYSDGRRPDSVEVASLKADLSRRDFTMNALAMDSTGEIIDLHGGLKDIENGLIRLVGGHERFVEDPLRMIRALRFSLQLGFYIDDNAWAFLRYYDLSEYLPRIDNNRLRDELTKMFKIDTLKTLEMLEEYRTIRTYIFEETPIWLKPTVEGK